MIYVSTSNLSIQQIEPQSFLLQNGFIIPVVLTILPSPNETVLLVRYAEYGVIELQYPKQNPAQEGTDQETREESTLSLPFQNGVMMNLREKFDGSFSVETQSLLEPSMEILIGLLGVIGIGFLVMLIPLLSPC